MALEDEQQATKGLWSKQDQEDLNAINAAIDHMRAFTPADPYILTIPQDVEPRYHHSYKYQAGQWLEHTPFDYREHESTQYQTFVFHEPGKDMYMLHNSRAPDTGLSAGSKGDMDAKTKDKVTTGANTPNAVPKKKISLNAYKKKQAGSTPAVASAKELGQEVKKPIAKGPVERLKEDEDVLAAVEEDDFLAPPVAEKKELKRKREESTTKDGKSEPQVHQHDSPREDCDRALKKARRTPPAAQAESNGNKSTESQQPAEPVKTPKRPLSSASKSGEDQKLPPKLSPPPSAPADAALPLRLSPISIPALPSRLSPTMPSKIAETLKVRAHNRSVSRSSEVSISKEADSRLLTPEPPGRIDSGPRKKKSPRNAFRANSSSPAVHSDTEQRGRPVTPAAPRVRRLESEALEDSDEIPVAKPKKLVPETRPSLNVILKIKKSQREAVRRILKMRPKAQQDVDTQRNEDSRGSDSRHRERRNTNAKGVAQKIGPTSVANGVKESENAETPERKLRRSTESDESDAPPMKRKKAPLDEEDEPRTPKQSALLSPSSARRLTSPSTMRKEVLSAAMKREHSTDSNAHTPNAISHASPPATSQPVNGTSKPPSSQPSNKTPKQQAWELEQKRLEILGRELKHAATAHLKTLSLTHSDPAGPMNEQKLAAVKSLESLIAYMLAFTSSDESFLAADPKMNPSTRPWRSLHGFFGFVKRNCDMFPLLLGLACWLGVVFNAHILDLIAQHPSEGLARDQILEIQAMLQRAANDAESRLDIDGLQSAFPRTWATRIKGVLESERLEPNKSFAGGFKLPLGVQTSPLRAARAAYSMLEEWIGNEEGLDYNLKLKL